MSNPNAFENLRGKQSPQFSTTNQPSAKSKADGWAKRKAGKELAAAAMELVFKGGPDSDLKKKIAKYFGVNVKDITVEAMLHFRQLEKAIQKGDTGAYRAVMERAYGMPPQEIEQHNKNSGSINITRTVISKKV